MDLLAAMPLRRGPSRAPRSGWRPSSPEPPGRRRAPQTSEREGDRSPAKRAHAVTMKKCSPGRFRPGLRHRRSRAITFERRLARKYQSVTGREVAPTERRGNSATTWASGRRPSQLGWRPANTGRDEFPKSMREATISKARGVLGCSNVENEGARSRGSSLGAVGTFLVSGPSPRASARPCRCPPPGQPRGRGSSALQARTVVRGEAPFRAPT